MGVYDNAEEHQVQCYLDLTHTLRDPISGETVLPHPGQVHEHSKLEFMK